MKRRPVVIYTYNAIDILLASPTDPMPADKRRHQLNRMWQGLAALETAPEPSTDDWRVCSDAVNLLETLVEMGVCQDSSGLLMDAVTALAQAGQRYKKGHALRLTGQGMQSVRAVLEDYAEVLEQIPHRTALDAHRRTERRIHEISTGKKKPHDVEVMKL
jgi:uncharacterized protein YyaL (SSP411 family)